MCIRKSLRGRNRMEMQDYEILNELDVLKIETGFEKMVKWSGLKEISKFPGFIAELVRVSRLELQTVADNCIPEEKANLENGLTVELAIQQHWEEKSELTAHRLMTTFIHCMKENGSFLIPVQKCEKGKGVALLRGKGSDDIWLPVFTSWEKASLWPEEAEVCVLPMETAFVKGNSSDKLSGLVINPLAESLTLSRGALLDIVLGNLVKDAVKRRGTQGK